MFLLVITTVLSILSAFIPQLIKSILACICVESSHEKSLQNSESQLKNEMASVSMVDEFAKYARLQRKLIKVQQELKSEASTRMSSYIKAKLILSYSAQAVITVILIILVWLYHYTPVAVLPTGWLRPFGFLLSWPTGVEGGISITLWLLVLGTAIRAVTVRVGA